MRIIIGLAMLLAYGAPAAAVDLTLPDRQLTPGLTRTLTLKQICATRWGTDRRAVTSTMKRRVYANYGLSGPADRACVPDGKGRSCEVDHLVPRSLGGADAVANLWPQPFGTQPWNAARKDRLETRLSKDVCAGRITLAQARASISPDYRIAYRRYFGAPQ